MFKLLVILLLSCTKQVEIENLVQKTNFNQQQQLSRESVVGIISDDDALIGSGAYIEYKKKFYVITAAHVVKNEEAVKVITRSKVVGAKVTKLVENKDLAVLQLEEKLLVKAAKVQKHLSTEKLLGQKLCYSGFPNGHGPMTICGDVMGLAGPFHMIHSYVWFGSSGSAVMNEKKEIVGIISAIDMCTKTGLPIEDAGYFVEISQADIKQ